jgi:hypothetical protein
MSRIMDAQIAADMALAAMDNRASWDAMDYATWRAAVTGSRRVLVAVGKHQPQPRGARTDAPLLLAAHATMEQRRPIWVLED